MDGVALDRARPDDRDLDDQVVEAVRARLGQRLHLGPALDLEDAYRVGGLEHLEDLADLLGQVIEVEADGAVVLDQLDRLVDRREHPQAEQVELDQLDRLDIALVVLDDDPAGHRRPLEGGDIDQRRGGDQHPAAVDAQVAREAVHPGAELQPALPVREAGRAAGMSARHRSGCRRPSGSGGRACRSAAPRAGGRRSPGRSFGRRSCAGGTWRRRPSLALRPGSGGVAGPPARFEPGDAGRESPGPPLSSPVPPARTAGLPAIRSWPIRSVKPRASVTALTERVSGRLEELGEATVRLEVAPDHHRVVGLERLRHPIDERPGEAQRHAHLADDRAGPVGDDVADHPGVLGAVLVVDVLDHLFPALRREVDVDVRICGPALVDEPLEEQVVADRIDPGDPQDVGHDRVSRTAPALGRDPPLASETHQVPADQEELGQAGPFDHRQLVGELVEDGRGERVIALSNALVAELGKLAEGRLAGGHAEAGEPVALEAEVDRAGRGDLAGIGQALQPGPGRRAGRPRPWLASAGGSAQQVRPPT